MRREWLKRTFVSIDIVLMDYLSLKRSDLKSNVIRIGATTS